MITFTVTWTSATGSTESEDFDDADDAAHFAAALSRRGFPARVREFASAPVAWNLQGERA